MGANTENWKWLKDAWNWTNNAIQDTGNWIGKQAGYFGDWMKDIANKSGLDPLGMNDREHAIEDQKTMMHEQLNANKEAADYGMGLQKEMINYTSPAMQMQRLKDAGLNPAMMYGSGGAGGTTVGNANVQGVSGGSASDAASRSNARMNVMGMALQMKKIKSEIDVNESIAKSNLANANTQDQTRAGLVAKLNEEGFGKYIENIENHWKLTGSTDTGHGFNVNGWGNSGIELNTDAYMSQEATAKLLNVLADTGNKEAQQVLTSAKARGYATELANAIMHADAAATNAAANKLMAEFSTGSEINWKNFGEALVRVLALFARGGR